MYDTGRLSSVLLTSIFAAYGCSDSTDSKGTGDPGPTSGTPSTATGTATTNPGVTNQAAANGTTNGTTGGAVGSTTTVGVTTSATGGTATSSGPSTTTNGGAGGGATTSTVDGGVTTTTQGTTGGPVDGITVQLDAVRQKIQGFGINGALVPSGKSIPINDLFGLEGPKALGMSILRVGMGQNGQLEGGSEQMINDARGKGAKIIGSTWSPGTDCKSTGSRDNGYLKPECYESWSDTIAGFADQYDLYAMSIANESDFQSCPGVPVCTTAYPTTTFTAKQMVEWVKVAGPKVAATGALVIAPEASEWIHAWSNLSGTGSIVSSHPHSSDPHGCNCYGNEITAQAEEACEQKCKDGDGYDYGHWMAADPDAWAAFDILGVHQYDSQIGFAWPADVTGGVRDKEVWQTEMSGVRHWPEEGPSSNIDNGVAVAGWIHSALTVGEASAWLYWWYEAYYEDDNEGLGLLKNGTSTKRYYTYGNYSRFVRPGYLMVNVAGNTNADLLISAAKSEDGATVVVVVINKGAAAEAPISIAGGAATMCTPNVTSATEDLIAGTDVPVTDGVFTASLGATTVTTFVCN